MRHIPFLKKVAAPCAALLAAALWLLPALAQDSIARLKDPGFSDPKEIAVPFKHNEHNKNAKITKCATCHHAYPGAKGGVPKNATERRCSDCHKERPAPADSAPALMMAYHKLCQDCHTAKGRGPVNCSGCHKANAAEGASGADGAAK